MYPKFSMKFLQILHEQLSGFHSLIYVQKYSDYLNFLYCLVSLATELL